MVNIGYLLLCDDIAYSEKDNNHFVKNPLDVVLLDKVPSSYDFYMVTSLFNVNPRIEYIIKVEIFDDNDENITSMDTSVIFKPDPPKGKSSIGVITLKIHHTNFEFKDEGIYRLVFKISEKETGEYCSKEIKFPVFVKPKGLIEGDQNER